MVTGYKLTNFIVTIFVYAQKTGANKKALCADN
jgi:hypothetical protein